MDTIDSILNNKENKVLPIFDFEYEHKKVRTMYINGEIWFVAKDVCNILEIKNDRDALTSLELDDVGTTDIIDSLGRVQKNNIINEAGLYQLIF